MKVQKVFSFLAVIFLIVPLLAGCSSGPTKIDVTLASYAIGLSANSGKAGDYVFHVTNAAKDQQHEFVIFKTDLPVDQLPMKDDGSGNMIVDEEGTGVTHIDEVADIDPGVSQDLKVTLEPGNYIFVCNLVANTPHFTKGMHVTFTVK